MLNRSLQVSNYTEHCGFVQRTRLPTMEKVLAPLTLSLADTLCCPAMEASQRTRSLRRGLTPFPTSPSSLPTMCKRALAPLPVLCHNSRKSADIGNGVMCGT